jgi:hypothetical protein
MGNDKELNQFAEVKRVGIEKHGFLNRLF